MKKLITICAALVALSLGTAYAIACTDTPQDQAENAAQTATTPTTTTTTTTPKRHVKRREDRQGPPPRRPQAA